MKLKNTKNFEQFVNEGYANDDEKMNDVEYLRSMSSLHSLGMVSRDEMIAMRKEIAKKAGGSGKAMKDAVLGQAMTADIQEALESPEWKVMQDKGWKVVSTQRQLFNGTLMIATAASTDPDKLPKPGDEYYEYFRFDGYAIQITATKYIRRYKLKSKSAQDPGILFNNWPGDGAKNYINAFLWINANIDPKSFMLDRISKKDRPEFSYVV